MPPALGRLPLVAIPKVANASEGRGAELQHCHANPCLSRRIGRPRRKQPERGSYGSDCCGQYDKCDRMWSTSTPQRGRTNTEADGATVRHSLGPVVSSRVSFQSVEGLGPRHEGESI